MKNIIETDRLAEHSVEPYRFKVLGGTKVVEPSDEPERNSFAQEEEAKENTKEKVKEKTQKKEPVAEKNPPKDDQHEQFVQALLKKSDELSSNIVKLQMQIEKQEQEFEKRLEAEVQREREDSYKKGKEDTKKELENSVQEQKDKYLHSISQLEEEVKKNNEYISKVEEDLSQTAIEVAKEVIMNELKHSSSEIAKSLSHALIEELKDAKSIELKINPKDFDTLNDVYSKMEHIKVTPDNAIMPGGVIVLSDVGNLDGNISKRIEKVKNLVQI